nr:MAG TPA: hypothetical protein [Caudoviricetes sp.]
MPFLHNFIAPSRAASSAACHLCSFSLFSSS